MHRKSTQKNKLSPRDSIHFQLLVKWETSSGFISRDLIYHLKFFRSLQMLNVCSNPNLDLKLLVWDIINYHALPGLSNKRSTSRLINPLYLHTQRHTNCTITCYHCICEGVCWMFGTRGKFLQR